jgi:hypothetical protein
MRLEFQRTFETFVPRGTAAALPNLAIRKRLLGRGGGADRDRTGGLRLAKPALSQLSYSPK